MSDAVESMMWLSTPPWHNKGVLIEEPDAYNIESCIIAAGLNWEVTTKQCFIEILDGDSTLKPVDAYATLRTSDNSILGVVGQRYEVLQNIDAFKIFQPYLDARMVRLNTAGSLFEGKKIWILAEILGDPLVIDKEDIIRKFILLSHGHDGKACIRFGLTPIRVVCANTLAMAHNNVNSNLFKVKHTKSMMSNIEDIKQTIDLINQDFNSSLEQFKYLNSLTIGKLELEEYIKVVFDLSPNDLKISTRQHNTLEKIKSYFFYAPGAKAQSYWDAYNAITYYISHDYGRTVENRLDAQWFGKTAELSKKALELALKQKG